MKAGVDGLPISAKSSFKNSVDHEIDQVGIDFAIVVSQPVGDPHQILDNGNRLIEGKANRSVGLRGQRAQVSRPSEAERHLWREMLGYLRAVRLTRGCPRARPE